MLAIYDSLRNTIYLYKNGNCKSIEFIEDDSLKFSKNGTVHYVEFIEGSPSIKLTPTAFYVNELIEGTFMYLLDESDAYITDESGNRLMIIM